MKKTSRIGRYQLQSSLLYTTAPMVAPIVDPKNRMMYPLDCMVPRESSVSNLDRSTMSASVMTSASMYPAVCVNTSKMQSWMEGKGLIINIRFDTMYRSQPVMKYGFRLRPDIGTQSDRKPYRTLKHHGTAMTVNSTFTSAGVAPKSSIKYTIKGVRRSWRATPMQKYDMGMARLGRLENSYIHRGRLPPGFLSSCSSSLVRGV